MYTYGLLLYNISDSTPTVVSYEVSLKLIKMGRRLPGHAMGRRQSWHHYRNGHRRRKSVYVEHTITDEQDEKKDAVFEEFLNFISNQPPNDGKAEQQVGIDLSNEQQVQTYNKSML